MLSKNKITTYLLYAIGEIFLVVVGIFIAIQLDTWNNERVHSIENRKLLTNLLRDLKRDTARFYSIAEVDDGGSTSLKTGIENCEKLKKISYLQLNVQWVDSLLSINTHAGFPVLNPETNVYDQLKSTGKLYSIGSDTLRRKIINYYSHVARSDAYIDRFNEVAMSGMRKLEFVRTLRLDKENDPDFDLNNYPWLFDSKSPEMKTYRDAIDRTRLFQERSHVTFMWLRDRASELITAIELELDKK